MPHKWNSKRNKRAAISNANPSNIGRETRSCIILKFMINSYLKNYQQTRKKPIKPTKSKSWISHSKPKSLHKTHKGMQNSIKLSELKTQISHATLTNLQKKEKRVSVLSSDHQITAWKPPLASFHNTRSISSRKFSTNNRYQ